MPQPPEREQPCSRVSSGESSLADKAVRVPGRAAIPAKLPTAALLVFFAMTSPTPAIQALLAAQTGEWSWGQVRMRGLERGFDLRHAADRDTSAGQLRLVRITELRTLAQNTARGEFRPLKSAPDLPSGWHARAESPGDLEFALNSLYPGSVADWFATRTETPPVTSFREFTGRQTGMYRITAMLSDSQAAHVIGAMCGPACCLKRRLWTADELAADAIEEKSAIPCLEPCALLLEFARKAMRIEQEEPLSLALRPGDAAVAIAALESALASGGVKGRMADFNAAENPSRLRLVLEKLRAAIPKTQEPDDE